MLIDETLFYQTHIAALPKPNLRDLAFLQEWMKRPKMGNVYLLGQDSDIWEQPDILDLIALNARQSQDPLTTWMADDVVHWYHKVLGRLFRVSTLGAVSLKCLLQS